MEMDLEKQDLGMQPLNSNVVVSICCLAYNHEPYIRQCLDGFLMQKTDFPFEVLIHDDASTDRTADIIREYEAKYPDIIKPIYQTENQYSKGISPSRKYQYPRTKGKYIALCEGDDYWTDPNKLQKQVDFLETHEDVSMSFHNAKIINAEGNKTGDCRRYDKDRYVPEEDLIKNGGDFCPTASMIFRAQYIQSGYPDFCKNCHVGDYPLQLYLTYKGKVYYFDSEMSAYRTGISGSWSQTFDKTEFYSKINKMISELEMLDGINALFNYKYSSTLVLLQENYLIGRMLLQHRNKKKEIKKIFKNWIYKLRLRGRMKFFIIYHFYFLYNILAKISSYRRLMLKKEG